MPARFESVNAPIVRDSIIPNGTAYSIDDDIVITGFSGNYTQKYFNFFSIYLGFFSIIQIRKEKTTLKTTRIVEFFF